MASLFVNETVFEFNAKGNTGKVEFGDLPAASIEKILSYGLQRFINDACGGQKSEEEVKEIIAKQVKKLQEGDFTKSSGRKSLSNLEKASRTVYLKYFAKYQVMKPAEAKKYIAENDRDMILGHLFNKIASGALKKAITQFTPDDLHKVGQLRAKNEGKIEQEIKEELDRLNATVEIEMDFEEMDI